MNIMRRVKKGLKWLLFLLLPIMLLIACNRGKSEGVSGQQNNTGAQVSEDKESSATESSTGQGDIRMEDTTENNITEGIAANDTVQQPVQQKDAAVKEPKEIRDITSTELVKEIMIGWNLGNTMDATGGGNTLSAETSWGNPRTTAEMIAAVKEAGFNTIRIPTTWGNHIGEAPDYRIDEAWLNRVQEIVDYGRVNDMYVILNMHHEEWHFPSYDNLETAKSILTKVWAQIADRFQNYDEHLIFEGMNEPRMKGTNFEWTGGNEESRDVVNQLNAAFVETIRNAGGNNPLRHLMIPCYAASQDPKTWADFIVPEDDKVIVSIHAYTPYNFALNKNGTSIWSMDNVNDTGEVDSLMNNIYNHFISKGQPVILGEFGAVEKNGNIEARASWAEYYIRKAREKTIPCIWWDNGAFYGSGERFGLLNRRMLKWQFPEIVEALMKGLE